MTSQSKAPPCAQRLRILGHFRRFRLAKWPRWKKGTANGGISSWIESSLYQCSRFHQFSLATGEMRMVNSMLQTWITCRGPGRVYAVYFRSSSKHPSTERKDLKCKVVDATWQHQTHRIVNGRFGGSVAPIFWSQIQWKSNFGSGSNRSSREIWRHHSTAYTCLKRVNKCPNGDITSNKWKKG